MNYYHIPILKRFIIFFPENTQELKIPEFLKTLTDVEVSEGQSVKFRCKVKGYPQPRVTWYKDGQLLSSQLNCSLGKFSELTSKFLKVRRKVKVYSQASHMEQGWSVAKQPA